MATAAFTTTPHTTVFSKNPVVFTFDASANYVQENYRIEALLEINFGSGYKEVAVSEWRPHPVTHIVTMNIESWLNAVFKEYDWDNNPEVIIDKIIICNKSILPFKFSFYEKYDPAYSLASDPFQGSVIIGGLNFQAFPKINFFQTFLPSQLKFLTWLPKKINILHRQPFTLFYFNHSPDTWDKLALNVTAFFIKPNGVITQSSVAIDLTALAADPGKLFFFKCGPQSLNLYALQPDYELLKYHLTLVNNEENISETKTFIIDRDNRKRSRIFAYLNSLGGIDHFFTTGKADAKPEYTSALAVFEPEITDGEYNTIPGQKYQWNQSEALPVKVRTGYKTLEEINCMRDFFLSPFKLEFNRRTNKYLPILLDSKSINFPKDNDGSPSVEFTFRYAFDNKTFTPDGLPES